MKKTLLLVLVVAAVTAAAIVFFLKGKDKTNALGQGAAWVPGDLMVYGEAPDLDRTFTRWKATSLYQISQEPEWKAFTAKFGDFLWDNMPDKSVGEVFDLLKEADPASAFIAVPSVASRMPNFLGGISYRGKKTAVKGAIEKVRSLILRGGPPPKSEITTVEGTEVEVLSVPGGVSVAFAYRDNWFFFTSGVEPMKDLLQRYAGGAGPSPSLAKNAVYLESVKQAEAEPDLVWYVGVKAMAKAAAEERAKYMAGANVPPPKPSPLEIFTPEIVSYSLKLDGPLMRDRLYFHIPKLPKALALGNHLLGITSANSMAYGTLNTAGMDEFTKPFFASLDEDKFERPAAKLLKEKGLKYADLGAALGPEMAFYSDWASGGEKWPSFFLGVEVRDAAKGHIFAEAWVQMLKSYGQEPVVSEEGGTTFWLLSSSPQDDTPGVVAYDTKHLVFAVTKAQATVGLKHLKDGGPNLGQSETFKGALKTVVAPTGGVIYLDLKQVVERLLEKYTEQLKAQLAGTPEAAKYFDVTKFPSVQSLTRHFQPTMIAYGNAPEGFVIDASGSLSLGATLLPASFGLFAFRASPMSPPPPPAVQAQPATAPKVSESAEPAKPVEPPK